MANLKTLASQAISVLMLNIPAVYRELLAPTIAPHFPVGNLAVLQTLRNATNAYCVICTKHFLVCGAIIQWVLWLEPLPTPTNTFTLAL